MTRSAIVSGEILLRTSGLKPGESLFFTVVSMCRTLSAVYELIEWLVALASGEGPKRFSALKDTTGAPRQTCLCAWPARCCLSPV